MDLITPGFGLIFWQAISFLAIMIILGKFAWKPILKALKERESNIADALGAAEKARQEMAQLQADNEKMLDEAKLERDNILKEAREAANHMKEEAKEEAGKISSKMIEDAKAAINNEKKAALAEVKNEVASLSIQIAEKLLRKNLDGDSAQKKLVQDFIADLNEN